VALPENKPSRQPSITEPSKSPAESPEPVFEDIVPSAPVQTTEPAAEPAPIDPEPELQIEFTNEVPPLTGPEPVHLATDAPAAELFEDVEYDEFSDPGDEELLVSLAEEAEEHARFASELNQKSTRQNKEDYEKELRQLRSQQKKDRRDADEVSQVMVTECQALLRLFGIPYITAPMEAEAQCAELVKLGLVDGIVTDDSDTFLFGGTRVYKNMFNSNKFVECYVGSDMEKELSLSREQLISLAQLLGSDYTDGLQGVGPVTAVEILSEFPGKDGLSDFREWWHSVQNQTRPKEADAKSTFRRKFRKSQATKLFLMRTSTPKSTPTPSPSSGVFPMLKVCETSSWQLLAGARKGQMKCSYLSFET
jgi:DNA excision repair protein ERCC-5